MALFYASIRNDSFSLFRFIFLWIVQVFLCEITSVCRLKYPYSYFSSHFCFLAIVVVLLIFTLSELFLVAVISFSLFILI